MQFAEVFCPAACKPYFRAWGALLHELRETLFELSDARIISIKTAWWAEELIGLAQGHTRHPLTQALLGTDAPWESLGRALLQHASNDDVRATDTAEAMGLLRPMAKAVIAVEAALFHAKAADDSAAHALAIHWLLQRLPQGMGMDDQARIPMHLFARYSLNAGQLAAGQGEALLRDWARELATALPNALTGNALIRRARARFDRARLDRFVAGKGFTEPPVATTFWRAWRAAHSP